MNRMTPAKKKILLSFYQAVKRKAYYSNNESKLLNTLLPSHISHVIGRKDLLYCFSPNSRRSYVCSLVKNGLLKSQNAYYTSYNGRNCKRKEYSLTLKGLLLARLFETDYKLKGLIK